MRILSASDVRRAVSMSAAIDAVAIAFAHLSAGAATVPLRTHIGLPQHAAISFFMPAQLGGDHAALGLKVVSVFPQNATRHHLPAIHALVVLIDPATGCPLAALDGTYLTALRTGAATGVATRLMARPNAHVLTLFGAGVQAHTQALAVCAVRSIERIWIVNRTRTRAEALVQLLQADGVQAELLIAPDPATALAETDVICCATTSPTPVFADEHVRLGTHINGIGSFTPTMAEVPPQTVARARIVVDQRLAAWAEAGDLVQARAAGFIHEETIVGELGHVVAGTIAGRTSDTELTFFKSVGNAIQDLAVAQVALTRATEAGLGVEVSLAL